MRDNVYQEYKITIHYSNRTGVRAICSDCHVPQNWADKMVRKMQASRNCGASVRLLRYQEKFEHHRMEMAHARMGAYEGVRFTRMPQLPQF